LIPAGGAWPRSFTIDPTGSFLLVANQKSNKINVLSIDTETGWLTLLPTSIFVPSPTFIAFSG
jgi:6-phosphogluconolactonase